MFDKLIHKYGSPLYVYNANLICTRYRELASFFNYPHLIIHYACKANSNEFILELLQNEGASIETVSPGEVLLALKTGFKPDQIIHTCSNISQTELAWLIKKRVIINLDSLNQIRWYGELKPGSGISIRVNQGIGAGHHAHVVTGGPASKFGIDIKQLDAAVSLAQEYGLSISGIHQHIGSNVLSAPILLKSIKALLTTARDFPKLKFIDFGGGFGVPYSANESPLNMKALGRLITKEMKEFTDAYGSKPLIRFEAGRYLVAESGKLLVTVTDIKKTPSKIFVGVDSGFSHLIRPAMYGSYHQIINLSRPHAKKETVTIAGNICESGDVFAVGRLLPLPKVGDVLAILNTGAYGYSMSSNYNLRPRPAELMITGSRFRLIREREVL
ncbi:MAG: diaminopimelate decarboxylase [Candidatus Berkelbacteria bacterium]|nr:diaminopimelate decarboxylase [Candidatus Berkelbacteria bacterium]